MFTEFKKNIEAVINIKNVLSDMKISARYAENIFEFANKNQLLDLPIANIIDIYFQERKN